MARPSKAKASKPIPDRVLDRLYGAAPEEFTANRNAAAKELKQAGDDETAEAVRALRRPNAPAAAINRAVRAEPEQARALLDAASDLRQAHEAVVGGEADRDTLKAAVAAERQAMGALAATAVAEAGGAVSTDVERRIRDTLEAVALDSQVRERFASGTLESDARAAGLAADLAVAAPARPKRERVRSDDEAKRRAEQERERRRLEAALRRAEAEVERRRADVEAAEQARERADAALREERKRVRDAEKELRAARRAAERAAP